ncbi:MAG TPA: polymer-forming cytoskeletal protein [Pyrinomonadaceae bacterium]|nr:polymer-forming cytoskeletal protein [Pyrinomonadaceae bacterium]
MGRSPKAESNEPAAAQAPSAPTQPLPPPPAQAYPYQPQPAAGGSEQPARTAPTPAAATPSAPRAVTESEALARDLREGVVSGFVGAGTSVTGDAEFKGMLRIDGRFTGRVRSEKGSLIVSAGGVVEANIEVASAKINGTVRGDITATGRVEFGRSARVYGNIQTPALVIEDGAIFEGGCRMQTQPKPEAAVTPKAEATKAEATRPATAATQPKPPAAKPAQTPAPAGNGAARAAAVTPTTSPEPTA